MDKSDAFGAFRPTPLSNRERLLLRRQAPKIRNWPVLALGRNNVISSVAKAIKTHFQKNHLAIVNLKGRAKGTSVYELVQATGSVLVSQEPHKIILYRGWRELENHTRESNKESEGCKPESKTASDVSLELMAAIRLECGWQAETSAAQAGDHMQKIIEGFEGRGSFLGALFAFAEESMLIQSISLYVCFFVGGLLEKSRASLGGGRD